MVTKVYKTIIPDLLEVQRASFFWFLTQGIQEELARFPSIFYLPNNIELRVYSKEYQIKSPSLSELNSQKKDRTYGIKLYLPAKITQYDFEKKIKKEPNAQEIEEEFLENDEFFSNEPLEEVSEAKKILNSFKISDISLDPEMFIDLFSKEKLYLGEIPLLTNNACFIYNGYKRVILHQIVRSPGLYYKIETKTSSLITGNIKSKTYIATVLPNLGSWLSFELEEILEVDKTSHIKEKNFLWVRIDKIYKIPIHWFLTALKLTKEEVFERLKNSINIKDILFIMQEELEEKRENDLVKINRSPNFQKRLLPFERNQATSEEIAVLEIQNLLSSRIFDNKYYDLGEIGRLRLNKKLGLNLSVSQRILTTDDILKIIDDLIDIKLYEDKGDDIDSLENRRVRCAGELLQLQFRLGLTRLERTILQKIRRKENSLFAHYWITPKPLLSVMKEFFGTSQLSQFMDEINPLSEVTHKRRVSSLGPGGLNSDHVSFVARDIHPTQYGRLCPIETSEGENAGLVASLATHAKIDNYGFLKTPFLIVEKGKIRYDKKPIYLTAEEERFYKIAPADTPIREKNFLSDELIPIRYQHEFNLAPANEINFVGMSTIQILSAGASLIPFLEHDDANRALMGSNMQRQAVPLLRPQQPVVGTGFEKYIGGDSRNSIINKNSGKVSYVSADRIEIYDGTNIEIYHLQKYLRSNQDTCMNQTPIVWLGEIVKKGQILADGSAMVKGELALGQNLIVAYMPWEGYNYEDAIVVSERLIHEDLFTSVHIERHEIEIEETRIGAEEITRRVPGITPYLLRNLDKDGLVYKGAMVYPQDVLVGKVAPKGEINDSPEVKLLNAIFKTTTPTVYDTSLKVPAGGQGRVIEINFSSGEKNFLPGTTISIYIAQIRKIQIGDKIAGRHGNKGVISKILPYEDMPYLPDGNVIDIILNPLGVPSRMNVGQIFECLLGFAGDQLQQRFTVLPFDEKYGVETSRALISKKLQQASKKTKKAWLFNPEGLGKIQLTDGRTGEIFDNPVLIGNAYIIKLIHLVDDKIHARSTGPYSLVTQQPLGGKSHHGGQRFGEMEVWALEAYGAAYTLQEILTIKSDDISGRNEMFSSLVRGKLLPLPGIPESFNVLLCELRALGIDLKTYKVKKLQNGFTKNKEIDLMSPSNIKNARENESNFQKQKLDIIQKEQNLKTEKKKFTKTKKPVVKQKR